MRNGSDEVLEVSQESQAEAAKVLDGLRMSYGYQNELLFKVGLALDRAWNQGFEDALMQERLKAILAKVGETKP
jgi:hypothetical protein